MIKLLIAEDEAIEREALKKILARGLPEAEVLGEAANGREAIRLAGELRPDIILMDVKMPGIGGIEAVKVIRKAHPAIKFVVVSAYDTFEYAQELMREGVKEYLLKPTKKEEIIHTVGRVIREIRTEKSGQNQFGSPSGEYRPLASANDSTLHDDRSHSILREAEDYIHNHFQKPITLEDTAAQIDLSPYYFSKLFKETKGMTFIAYLTEVRIHRAKELLESTRLSQKEICFEVGYHDPNYFSRVFKKNIGYSPSEYRAANQSPKF